MFAREARHAVMIAARMRGEAGWIDIAIRNVSLHGMMLQAPRAPRPGTYLEIRLADLCYAVRTVWSQGRLFGVKAQQLIDLSKMLRDRREWDRGPGGPRADRRRLPRADAPDRSRRTASAMQMAFCLILALIAGAALERTLSAAFVAPLRAVTRVLGDGDALP